MTLRDPQTTPGQRETDTGATLVEVLVAGSLFSAGVLAVAQLLVLATADNITAAQDSVATILAAQKLEELRAPASPDVLDAAPAGTLDASVPGFVDHVGADGRVVGTAPVAPDTAVFTRRWSVEPLGTGGGAVVLVRVIAMPARRGSDSRAAWGGRLPGAARVASVVARSTP